jgi:hypothetical protein
MMESDIKSIKVAEIEKELEIKNKELLKQREQRKSFKIIKSRQ